MQSPVQQPRPTGRFDALIWMAAALVAYVTFLFVPAVLNDGDTYMHLAAGEWMARHGAVPHADPFSYTFAGAHWVAHEWLAEVVMWLAFHFGGWSGLLILFGGATALTIALLARHLSRWLDPLPMTLMLVTAGGCMGPSLLARPHVLALPVLELWTAGLVMAHTRKRVPWPILPLMLVWANLHGSFILGLLLIIPFAFETMNSAAGEWKVAVRQWALFAVAAVIMASATPQGLSGLAFPLRLMSMRHLGAIGEWRVPDFQTVQPIELALMAFIYVCLSRGVRLPLGRLLTLMVLLHLALQHTRHQMIAGIVGPLILAEPLSLGLSSLRTVAQRPKKTIAWPIAALLAVGAALTILRFAFPASRADGPSSPISALAHLPADLTATPVLNGYDFGGYLIFKGVHPFIDARADLYGDDFLGEYEELMRPDRARLERTIETRRINWTILEPHSGAVGVMDSLQGWHRVYSDDVAVVHARTAIP